MQIWRLRFGELGSGVQVVTVPGVPAQSARVAHGAPGLCGPLGS